MAKKKSMKKRSVKRRTVVKAVDNTHAVHGMVRRSPSKKSLKIVRIGIRFY